MAFKFTPRNIAMNPLQAYYKAPRLLARPFRRLFHSGPLSGLNPNDFSVQNPDQFVIDPSKFLVQEPTFLTDLSEIDRPLAESEQQALMALVPEETEARKRLINQVAGTGRFGSPISSYDFAPLEQSILGNRAGIRGSFAEKRAQARERARQQLLALRQSNAATQREVEQGNVELQAAIAQKQSETNLQLALARIMAKVQSRRDLASLIGGGIGAGAGLLPYLFK